MTPMKQQRANTKITDVSKAKIILASSSPRRIAYLKELGVRFHCVAPEIDETIYENESPRDYVRRLAILKAKTVAKLHPQVWVLGADTTVVVDNEVLGKPKNPSDAKRMLNRLAGRTHHVLSGIALVNESRMKTKSAVSSTRVIFRSLSRKEIECYINTGEPFDKAGAYGAQGKGGILLKRIEGSFSNVVGLPLEKFYELWTSESLPSLWNSP